MTKKTKKSLNTELLSYREFLTAYTILCGAPILLVAEVVASFALDHPEIDFGEVATWDEWLKREKVTLP